MTNDEFETRQKTRLLLLLTFAANLKKKNIVDEVLTHSFNVQPCGSAKLPLS